jgi:hypothetical protein
MKVQIEFIYHHEGLMANGWWMERDERSRGGMGVSFRAWTSFSRHGACFIFSNIESNLHYFACERAC